MPKRNSKSFRIFKSVLIILCVIIVLTVITVGLVILLSQKSKESTPKEKDVHIKCGKNWALYKHKCVKYFNQKVKFETAEKICESNNATMVSIHSDEENEFIRSYVEKHASHSTKVWLGLKRNISQGFEWIDKSPFDYRKWSFNESDNAGSNEPYVEMWINGNGLWNYSSDNNYTFICEINYFNEKSLEKLETTRNDSTDISEVSRKCRNGWTRYKHKCLKFFDYFVIHSNAENICQSNGGTLISIHSGEENKFAIDLANRDRPIRAAVWIGTKRNNSADYFEWTNGQEFNYSNWASGEPKNSTDPESHFAMINDGTWGEYQTWFYNLFICERDSSDEKSLKKLETTRNHSNDISEVKCGNDWVQYKQRCVKYFNQKFKFLEAEQICESNNATLISIHSSEENEFIRNYVEEQPSHSTRVWIGLKRNIYDSHEFVWVDGSPVDYVNWNLDEPNNDGGSERFVEMWIYVNGTWNDMENDNLAFICGFNYFPKEPIIDSKVQPTSGHFLPVIITFSALAFVAILVVIFGVIIRRRKESIKKQRPKNENHENEFDFDDGSRYYEGINDRNEENSYEMINYYGINYNKSNIESNSSKTVVYLDISK